MGSFYTDTPTPTRTELLRAALGYAKRGVHVFPCAPAPDKSPRTPHGFKDATTDPRRITAWWNARPDSAIGISTGEASGVFVLDEDRAGALDELPHALPETLEAGTPRGGRHLYFKYPAGAKIGNSTGTLPKGIDVRGEGGYILAAPSTGYSWTNRADVADAPAWLLEALRTPERADRGDVKGDRPAVSVEVAGDPIPDGERNGTLARIAGKLHDGTRSEEQLVADLEAVNVARCKPPVSEAEVAKIARSIYARTPCRTTAPNASYDVLEALDAVEEHYLRDGERWKGTAGGFPRSTLVEMLRLARRHGQIVEGGVWVAVSIRQLATLIGTSSKATVAAAIERLDGAGIVTRANKGDGPKAGAFIIKFAPRAKLGQSSTGAASPSTVPTSRAPFTADRLRWSKPIFESEGGIRFRAGTVLRLGKKSEAVVDFLEVCPGGRATVSEIAAFLGMSRLRELTRRRISSGGRDGVLTRLQDAGVIEVAGDGVHLRLDWLAALDRRREEDQEIADRERDRRKFAEQSRMHGLRLDALKLWKVMDDPDGIARALNASPVEVRYVLGLPAAPVRDEEPPRKEADGLIEDLQRVAPVENASTEGPGAAESDSPASEDTPEGDSTPGNRPTREELIEFWADPRKAPHYADAIEREKQKAREHRARLAAAVA